MQSSSFSDDQMRTLLRNPLAGPSSGDRAAGHVGGGYGVRQLASPMRPSGGGPPRRMQRRTSFSAPSPHANRLRDSRRYESAEVLSHFSSGGFDNVMQDTRNADWSHSVPNMHAPSQYGQPGYHDRAMSEHIRPAPHYIEHISPREPQNFPTTGNPNAIALVSQRGLPEGMRPNPQSRSTGLPSGMASSPCLGYQPLNGDHSPHGRGNADWAAPGKPSRDTRNLDQHREFLGLSVVKRSKEPKSPRKSRPNKEKKSSRQVSPGRPSRRRKSSTKMKTTTDRGSSDPADREPRKERRASFHQLSATKKKKKKKVPGGKGLRRTNSVSGVVDALSESWTDKSNESWDLPSSRRDEKRNTDRRGVESPLRPSRRSAASRLSRSRSINDRLNKPRSFAQQRSSISQRISPQTIRLQDLEVHRNRVNDDESVVSYAKSASMESALERSMSSIGNHTEATSTSWSLDDMSEVSPRKPNPTTEETPRAERRVRRNSITSLSSRKNSTAEDSEKEAPPEIYSNVPRSRDAKDFRFLESVLSSRKKDMASKV